MSSKPPSSTREERRLIAGLIDELMDDAAIFPPGNASLSDALAAHSSYSDTRYEAFVGPLLVRSSAIEELRKLADPDRVTRLAIVADSGIADAIAARDAIQDDPWFELVQVEVAVPEGGELGTAAAELIDQLAFSVPTYIEVPQGVDPTPAIAAVASDGAERAKFRCGPKNVPTSRELARFIATSAREGVTFKLTAGLHHALPADDVTSGVRQHGYLNALAASWVAIRGGSDDDVTETIEQASLAHIMTALSDANISQLRSIFHSIGSCSISEPIDDLYRLGLLDEDDS